MENSIKERDSLLLLFAQKDVADSTTILNQKIIIKEKDNTNKQLNKVNAKLRSDIKFLTYASWTLGGIAAIEFIILISH